MACAVHQLIDYIVFKHSRLATLNVDCVELIHELHRPHLTLSSNTCPHNVESGHQLHLVFDSQWVAFAVFEIIQFLNLVEVHNCPPWRKIGVGIGCLYIMCCEPLPQHFVVQLHTIRLLHSWCLVSLIIWSYTILHLFYQ